MATSYVQPKVHFPLKSLHLPLPAMSLPSRSLPGPSAGLPGGTLQPSNDPVLGIGCTRRPTPRSTALELQCPRGRGVPCSKPRGPSDGDDAASLPPTGPHPAPVVPSSREVLGFSGLGFAPCEQVQPPTSPQRTQSVAPCKQPFGLAERQITAVSTGQEFLNQTEKTLTRPR